MDRDFRNFHRGEIYFANLNPYFGSEYGGTRPVLILQNEAGNHYSPTVIVAPATRRTGKKPMLPTHVALKRIPEMQGESLFLLEQIRVIDKHRIRGYAGHLTRAQMAEIDAGIRISLGLEEDAHAQ